MAIAWSVLARDDLRRIRDYIGAFNPTAARRLSLALVEAADSLVTFPERGRPLGGGRRELVVVWPYVIRYRVSGPDVQILRIRHGAQHSASR
jgi:toxin ParE1/3/4